ncbi:nuclear factor erythroid 2-related factor 3 isoform X3 [Myotis myotis]|uniref:nuclear factor erythroid 2-related factor 3 isoform X3 n=1 Tax=Myotis myotis TaxID=51298 RepID=UPI0017482ECE|nr:nuclear factor erythroid 2-related factor 3 isoform X3 [Myotis myotis]
MVSCGASVFTGSSPLSAMPSPHQPCEVHEPGSIESPQRQTFSSSEIIRVQGPGPDSEAGWPSGRVLQTGVRPAAGAVDLGPTLTCGKSGAHFLTSLHLGSLSVQWMERGPWGAVRIKGDHASSAGWYVENEVLRATGHSPQQEENEHSVSAQKDKSLQQQGDDETKAADTPEWGAEKTTDTRNERYLNETDTSLSLEDLLQLLSSQPENSMEGISLGDIPLLSGSINDGMNSSAYYNVNCSQAVSHDVNLHEAMLLCPDSTFRRDPVGRTSQPQEPFLQLNSHTTNPAQTLPGTNLTGFLPPVDHQIRNLTSHDLLYDLDINIFDEINSMSLATEGFDAMEVSHLFGEPDSDSGLSLNSSHNSTSVTNPNSCVCDSAIGSSSDLESLSHHALEGAVGGYYPEPSKIRHIDLSSDSTFHGDLAFQHIFHNHTYHLQSSVPESTSESFLWPGKSQKIKSRYLNDTDRNLSRDERRAKALHIPFSVDEIVHMPVDSFNSMLSRYYLTDLQVSLIRDIRRRGKNKVAAQNCRKRKLDIILNLEDDVCNLQAKKETLKSERAQCNKAINIMKQKLHDLYHDILSRLRDDEGRPVNPNQYALQCSHDGSILIVPKELVTSGYKKETQKGKRKSERRN